MSKRDKVRYISLNGRSSLKCRLVSLECKLISPDAQNATISTLGKTRGDVGDAAASEIQVGSSRVRLQTGALGTNLTL